MWKFTAIGVVAVVATAVITGLVVANRDRAEYQCAAVVGGPGADRTSSRFTLVGRVPQRDNSRTALRRAVPTSRERV